MDKLFLLSCKHESKHNFFNTKQMSNAVYRKDDENIMDSEESGCHYFMNINFKLPCIYTGSHTCLILNFIIIIYESLMTQITHDIKCKHYRLTAHETNHRMFFHKKAVAHVSSRWQQTHTPNSTLGHQVVTTYR